MAVYFQLHQKQKTQVLIDLLTAPGGKCISSAFQVKG